MNSKLIYLDDLAEAIEQAIEDALMFAKYE